jgi:hypothetical protein
MPVKTKKSASSDTPALRLKNARALFRTGLPHALGVRPVNVTPAKITASMKRDIPRYRKIMAEAGIVPQ